jgi:hypothetical protein
LRTLTLGVLIVTGGTLASLPFRRYQSIPDASARPAQATGPTQSELREANFEKLEMLLADSNEPLDAGDDVNRSADRRRLAMLPAASRFSAPTSASAGMQSFPSTSAGPGSGRFGPGDPRVAARGGSTSIPLTYEDLAVPIEQPQMIQEKFNATTQVRQQESDTAQSAGLVMPRLESLALAEQEKIQSFVTVVETPSHPRRLGDSANAVEHMASSKPAPQPTAATQFASSSLPAADAPPLVESGASVTQRHWIRQPD